MSLTNRHKSVTLPVVAAVAAMLSLAGLCACNNAGCADNHSALPLMGFYNYFTGAKMPLDSIDLGGVGAPGDSLLVHSGERRSQVYLPFRQDATRTVFYIHYDYREQGLDNPLYNDTLTFTYSCEPYFASSECGAMYQYRVLSATTTRHLIDSIAVTDSLITNVERERIQLFFRAADGGEDDPGEGDDQ